MYNLEYVGVGRRTGNIGTLNVVKRVYDAILCNVYLTLTCSKTPTDSQHGPPVYHTEYGWCYISENALKLIFASSPWLLHAFSC